MNTPEKTEKKQSCEDLCRDIVDNAPEIILKFNTSGEILFASRGASDISGYLIEELRGMNMADVFPPLHYENISRMLFGEKAHICLYETEFIDRELRLIPVEINARCLMKEGTSPEFLLIARDITPRKIPENEKLRTRYFEVMERFSADVAHHLEKLFEDIIAEIEFVRGNSDPHSTAFRRLSDARNSCEWGRHMILDFVEALSPDVSDMKSRYPEDIIRKSALPVAADFGMECEFSIPNDLWPAVCDETQMARVFHHLVLNAAEAGSAGGKIFISAENISPDRLEEHLKTVMPLEEYIKISVQNYGTGISEAMFDRIFDPYVSTKNRSSEDARGLGLAAVYSVVKKHSGYVDVKSNPGGKTVFSVYLPVFRNNPIKNGESSSGQNGKTAVSKAVCRILLMDDEDIIREVAGNMLRVLGYQVSFARNGEEAAALYKAALNSTEPFDMVILDLNVEGGRDGKTAVRELLEADPNVKAVAASGYSNDPVMTDYRKHGFAAAVNKPYSLEELQDVLNAVMIGKT
ncbi:MAG: ATP-binding protein [Desulfococcaceae bacterium]